MRAPVIVASLFAAVALVFASGCASTPETTATADSKIAHHSWAEVEAAMASGAVLVDARGPDSFAKGHIAGAVNIPYKAEAGDKAWANLPADKNTPVITYCGGPKCSASLKCAEKVVAMGYTKVGEYKGGYPEWAASRAN